MRKITLLVILLLSITNLAIAQHIIKGKVTEEIGGLPLIGVIVTVRQHDSNKILKFTQTNNEGEFQLDFKELTNDLIMRFALMSYQTTSLSLDPDLAFYAVKLKDNVTELKEVVIHAPKIRQQGDTLTYYTAQFAKEYDKTIGNVLEKLPGIEIRESGQIWYNGKKINKFYIDGKDMLGGKYSLATNNIHHKDVASIDIMENHQSVKALEGISFSENPAINIKLKEDAKARWVGTLKAGTGYQPWSWLGELMLMRFTSKIQTLNVYKTNNIGVDVSKESKDLINSGSMSMFGNYSLTDYVSISPKTLSEISAERHRFNKTHLVSSNTLWSLTKNSDLTTQINYSNNRLDFDNLARTEHYLAQDTLVVNEQEDALTKQNNLAVTAKLLANTPDVFLTNVLSGTFDWNSTDIRTSGTYPNQQTAKLKYASISNDLKFIKRTSDKHTFSISTFNHYQRKPQHLMVAKENVNQAQEVNSSVFFTKTHTSFSFLISPFTLSLGASIVGAFRNMDSQLEGFPNTELLLVNDLRMRYLDLALSPELEYSNRGFRARLSIPVSYLPYFYKDKIENEKNTKSKFIASPKLFLEYTINANWQTLVSLGLSQQRPNEQQFYNGVILQNYRNLTQGYINYKTDYAYTINTSWSYKNVIKMLFFNFNLAGSLNNSSLSPHLQFIDEYIVHTYQEKNNKSRLWMLRSDISKGINSLDGLLSLRVNVSNMDATSYQNDVKTNYSTLRWSVQPQVSLRLTKWLDGRYNLTFAQQRLKKKNSEFKSIRNNLSQVLALTILPSKAYYLKLNVEHYYNQISKDLSKHFVFADLDLIYNFKKGPEVSLGVKNILNQKRYDYTLFDGLSSTYRSFTIRPFNVLATVLFRI